jgi:hypothetical protein
MKKFIFFILCLTIFVGCSNSETSTYNAMATEKPLHTYVVEYAGKIDTIVAQRYNMGNFVGCGRAVHFYVDTATITTVLIPKNREFVIKTIK